MKKEGKKQSREKKHKKAWAMMSIKDILWM